MAKQAKAKKVDNLQLVATKFNEVKSEMDKMDDDFEKFNAGTAAAGRRLRKSAQVIKKAMQELRLAVQAKINESK